MKLWSINRWLRWTGFRLVITTGGENTLLSLKWWGSPLRSTWPAKSRWPA